MISAMLTNVLRTVAGDSETSLDTLFAEAHRLQIKAWDSEFRRRTGKMIILAGGGGWMLVTPRPGDRHEQYGDSLSAWNRQ